MKKELDNELEPLPLQCPDFWEEVILKFAQFPDKVLPVYFKKIEEEDSENEFFLKLVKMDDKYFMQIEGFNSFEWESSFSLAKSDNWVQFQPGIYRMDVTEEVKGLIY